MFNKLKVNWKTVLLLILVIECGLILYVNFTNRLQIVNQDAANAYVHTVEMWKNRSFFIPQWKYETTAEWDCAAVFAMPLYGLTHNIHIAFALSNTIFLFIFVWTTFKLYEECDPLYPLLTLCFILIPYSVGMLLYFNMLFFMASQYIVKILVPLMLAAVLLHFDYHKKADMIFLAILCFFTFLTACSSGIYVWGCGIMAVLCGYGLLTYARKEKIGKNFCIISILLLLCTAAGYLIERLMQTGTLGNDLMLRPVGEELWLAPVTVLNAIAQMFSLTDRESEVSIFSKDGIKELLLLFLMFVLLFCALRTIYRVMHGKIEMLPALLCFLFVWNTLIQCLNVNGDAGRYHLMGIVPLFFVAAYYFAGEGGIWQDGILVRQAKVLFITTFLIVQIVLSYRELFAYRDDNEFTSRVQSYNEICAVAETQDVEYVYLITRKYWSEICRMIGIEGNIKYLFIDKELGEVQVRDYYLMYDHASFCTQNALLVADTEDDSDMEYIDLFGESIEQIAAIDNYCIYKFK